MKKPANSLRTMMIVMLVCAICLVGYLILFTQVRSSVANHVNILNEITLETQRERRLEAASSLLKEIQNNRAIIHNHFVFEDEIIDLVRSIERLADELGVELKISNLNTQTAGSLGNALSMQMSMTANWANTLRLIALTEQAPFAIQLQQINLSTDLEKIEPEVEGASASGNPLWHTLASVYVLMDE